MYLFCRHVPIAKLTPCLETHCTNITAEKYLRGRASTSRAQSQLAQESTAVVGHRGYKWHDQDNHD